MLTNSISIVVPAFNEEAHIEATCKAIKSAAEGLVTDFEILLINDCSTDRTGQIAKDLAMSDPKIRAFDNPVNLGFGASYRRGLNEATKKYVIIIPGDNEIEQGSIRNVFAVAGHADLIIPYTANQESRPRHRQIISRLYTQILNFLFGLNLRYYNGICLLPREIVQATQMTTDGFAYMTQILVRLIVLKNLSFIEVEMRIIPRQKGQTKAFSLRNITSVFTAIGSLWLDVQTQKFLFRSKKNKNMA